MEDSAASAVMDLMAAGGAWSRYQNIFQQRTYDRKKLCNPHGGFVVHICAERQAGAADSDSCNINTSLSWAFLIEC